MKTLIIILIAAMCACVSVEDVPASRAMIRPQQKTVVIVYPAPGPWVTRESDTKAESAAKYLPGLGLMVQSAQDSRDLQASESLKPYLPPWNAEAAFYPLLLKELDKIGYPGVWISSGPETETSQETLKKFNRAKDILDWRARYFLLDPSERRPHRDYSTLLSLDEALVLEVNLQYGLLLADESEDFMPALHSLARLYRAGTMRLLWSHEDSVKDLPAAKSLQDFMVQPRPLLDAYEKLMPALAGKIAAGLRAAIHGTGAPPATSAPSAPPAPLTPPATGQTPTPN